MNLSLSRAFGRRALAASAALGTALLLVTCTGEPVAPGAPRLGQITIAPIWPEASRLGGLVLDNVRLTVVRLPSDTLSRTARAFPPTTTQLQLTVPVLLLGPSENLQVTLELLSGTTLLFSGTQLVSVTAGGGSNPVPIPVTFTGPGTQVASLTLAPRDTTISAGGTFAFTVTAQDSSQASVTQFYTTWSSSAAAVTIDGAGVVTAGAGRATVTITAVTPSGARDSTTLTVVPPATQLVLISGDNQSASILSPLPLPLVVEVQAADGLPVAGATVTFAVLSGGGSVDSATATTDLAGRASSGATLGATVGAQSFTAAASGTNSVTFSATATSGGVKTWTGAVSADWNTAGNWTPAALPTAGDSVAVIAGTPNDPTLTGNATMRALALQGTNAALFVAGTLTVTGTVALPDTNSFIDFTSGQLAAGSVTLAGFQAFIDVTAGSAAVSGPITLSGNRAFFEAGPGSALGAATLSGTQAFLTHDGGTQGPITASGSSAFWEADGAVTVTGTPAVQLSGTAFLNSSSAPVAVTINGDVTVGGTAAFFDASGGGDHWTINGNLQTTGGGTLYMSQVTDTVEVNGNVSFGGGDESTQLTAGQLFVSGNFSQTGLATSFVGTGSHIVFLDGSGSQTLSFTSPGFAASRFQNVIIANSAGGVTATSDIFASGTAGVTPTAVRTLSGNGSTLFTTILNVSNFTFNNLLLNFTGSTVATFDTVTFQGYAPTATPLTIVHPGAAAPLPFQDIVFTVTPTSGFYLDATDSNPTDGVPLIIDMLNPTPATDGGFVQLAGGATVNWPPAPPVKAWTGTIDTDWSNPGNWSPAGVPGALDVVTIGPTTNQPTLTAGSVAGSVTIAGLGARLTVAGQTLTISGSLVTHTDGLLVMTNPADLVIVAVDATFQGGDETGLLSAGELRVAGDFGQQDQTNTRSFFASGTHRTVMNGTALQGVRFCCTAGASGFQELDISNSVGINIQFSGNGVFVYDTLISQVGAGTAPWLYMLGSPLTAARLRVDKLLVDRGTLTLNEGGVPANQQFDNVTFQNYLTSQTQFAIVAPGGAAGPRTLTFNNLQFQPLIAGNTGRYLNVTAPSGTLIVDLPGASPGAGGNGPAFTTTSGAVTVAWPVASPVKTWTGATSTDWNTATNWSTGAVPTNADDVVIPSAPINQPTVTTSCSAKSLTVNVGATLNLGSIFCQVQGDVFADGSITGSGAIQISTTAQLRGNVPSLILSGPVTLAGRTVVAGGVTMTGASGDLTLGGQTMTVVGSFVTQSSATLTMTNALDSLLVTGAGIFGGNAGSLTGGYLKIGGSFTQTNGTSNTSFAASGTHTTELGAAAVRVVNFASPGLALSHFHHLIVTTATGGLSLVNNTFLTGQLISHPTGATPLIGVTAGPRVLTVGGVDVSRLTIDQNGLSIGAGTITQFDTVSFTGLPISATQLTVNHPGTGGPFSFSNLSFSPVPTTGFYLSATDPDGATNGFLTINLVNPNPATPGTFVQAVGGAVINWPAAAPGKTWLGATQDWQTTTNWSPAGLPTTTDDVVIPVTANNPVLSAAGTTRNLTVQSGVLLNLNSFALDVNGSVTAPAATSFISGGGTLNLLGTGATLGGTLSSALPVNVSGTYTLSGRTVVGNLSVTGAAGGLAMGGQTLAITGNLSTSGSGTITMTNVLDSVIATGNATFGGGSESGLLTAGVLSVGGTFAQTSGGSAARFDASGTHRTVLTGASPTVSIQSFGNTPGTSHFQELTWAGGGTLSISTLTYVVGQLTVNSAGTINKAGFTDALHVGGLVNSGVVTFNNVQLWIETTAPVPVALSNVTFTIGSGTGVTNLMIRHPGLPAGGKLTIDNGTFTNVPSFPATYIDVDDTNPLDGNLVVVDVTNSSPAASALVTLANGATINWPPASPVFTWTGTTSTDWDTGSNWSTGTVPTATGNIVIPAGTPNSPSIFSNVTVNDLTIQAGATLSTNDISLAVDGNLDASGLLGGCCSDAIDVGGGSLRGNFDGVVLIVRAGAVMTLNGAATLTNSTFQVNGELILGGQTLDLGQGALNITNGTGLLTMTNPADLVVTGIAEFSGGDETGRLTAGELQTQSLFQGSGGSQHPASFFASGNHRVVLGGPSSSSVTLFNPTTSRFQALDVTGVSATLTLQSDVTVAGQLISLPLSTPPTINTTGGATLSAGGADVTGLVLDGVPLVLTGGLISGFSNVTFQNQNPLGTHLRVNNVGTPAAFTFGNLNFTTGLSAGGFYIVADDLDGGLPDSLRIDVLSSNPASGAGVSQATNGAILNWPPGGSSITWTGATSTDWFTGSNWSGGVVPAVSDTALIFPGPPGPVLTAGALVGALNVQPSAVLDLNAFVIVVNQSVDNQGVITSVTNGGLALVGTGSVFPGVFNTDISVNGTYNLVGGVTAAGNFSVANGFLDLNGNTLSASTFATLGTGVVQMTNPLDSLLVGTIAIFQGGSTVGLLTDGVLSVGGDFFQDATNSTTSFSPSGKHKTVLTAQSAASIIFFSPGLLSGGSHFQVLDVSQATGGYSLNVNSFADSLISTSAAVTLSGGNSLTVRRAQVSGLTLDDVPLILDEQGTIGAENLSNITFQGFPTTGAQVLTISGPGSNVGLRPAFGSTNLNFPNLPTGAGNLYVKLTSTNAEAFIITMTGSNQSPQVGGNGPALSDPPNQTTVNGAQINWP